MSVGEDTIGRRLLHAWMAATLVFVYWQFREADALALRMESHALILGGEAHSPFLYRVLAPLAAESMRRLLEPLLGEPRAFHLAYLAWNLAWGYLTFALADRLFRRWHPAPTALAGSLLLAVPLLVSFAEQPYSPWSVAETPLFLAGVLAFLEGRAMPALAVVALATLNRETALYLPLAWALLAAPGLDRWAPSLGSPAARTPSPVALALGGGAVWAVVWAGLRLARGDAPPILTAAELMERNLDPRMLAFTLLYLVLLLGPLWAWAARGWSRADPELRRLALVGVPVMALYLRFAIWREVRVLLPLLPVVVALALHALPGRVPTSRPRGAGAATDERART